MDRADADPLQAIRSRIDAIDEEMHRLLIDRSGVIAELIRIKGTSRPATAFRPDREADMMRRMVMRHEGELPLVTVEHIWREIITTFTAMQAPFGIAAGPAADPLVMRDLIRFYFGFSIPVTDCTSSAAAIERVTDPGSDIAVIAAETGGRWWAALTGPQRPKIFASLPFIDIPARPAELPAYVIGLPLGENSPPDIRVYAIPDRGSVETAILSHGGRIAARAEGELLAELPLSISPDDLADQMSEPAGQATLVGGFAQPIRYVAPRTS